jgi:cell division GTPase FtsZ
MGKTDMLFRIPVVVSVGSGGGRILSSLNTNTFGGYKIAINNSERDLSLLEDKVDEKICVGDDQGGSGMDSEKGRSDFLKGAGKFLKSFKKNAACKSGAGPDIIPIIGTLGHGFASGSFPEIYRILRSAYSNSVIFAWSITPFDFQGKEIRERAYASLRRCKEIGATVTPVSNQVAFNKLGLSQSTPLSKLYGKINGEITSILSNIFTSFTTTKGVVESLDRNDMRKIWTGESALISMVNYPDASSISAGSLKDAEDRLLVRVNYMEGSEQPTVTYIIDGPGEITISQMEELSKGLIKTYKADMTYFKPLIIQRPRKNTSFTLIRGRMRMGI